MAMEQTPELLRYSRSPNYNAYHDLSDRAGQEAFRRLTKAEAKFMVPQSYFNDERNQRLRKSAVAFMETHSRSLATFDALIPYMAMTYFDRFVAEEELPTEFETDLQEFNLFLTCCLSIAWKLRTKTFNLLHFLQERNLPYSAERVLNMELLILKRLKWRMKTPTPFSFVEYFIPLLDLSTNKSPRRPVRQLIVKSQFDISFTEYRPSVLATSALLIVTSRAFPEHENNMLERRISGFEYVIPLKDMLQKCKKELLPLHNAEVAIIIDEATPYDQTKPTDLMVAPGETSAPFTRRTNPIPMPGRNLTRLETPFQPTGKAVWLGFAAKRSYAPNKEIDTGRSVEDSMDESTEGKENAVANSLDEEINKLEESVLSIKRKLEEIVDHRPGKEPAASHEVVHDQEEIIKSRPGKEPAANSLDEYRPRIWPWDVEADDELMDFDLGWIELQSQEDAQKRGENM